MDRISPRELLSLTDAGPGPRVTIYLPLRRGYPEARGNPARLRGALEQADRRLRDYALPQPEDGDLSGLLAPAYGLAEQEEFWRGCGGESLAVLLGPGFSRFFLLPFGCGESVDVGRHFRLAPLVRLSAWPDEYDLLALSLNAVQLYHGSAAGLAPVEPPRDVPRGFGGYLAGTEVGRAARFESAVGAGARPFFHGGTSHVDDTESLREEYVRVVAKAVAGRPKAAPGAPLVLAAAEELHPIFRAAYPGADLLEPGLIGCPDRLTESELRDRAARLLEARPGGAFAAARDRYRNAAKGRSAETVEAIVPAAAEGRVDSLILAFEGRVWGEWDAASGEARIEAVGPAGPAKSEDLAELALRETLRHGGRAFVVPAGQCPDGALITAVLRW